MRGLKKKMPNIYPDKQTAYAKTTSLLHKHFPINNKWDKHHNFHRLLESEKFDFYLIFKKDFFMTFNDKFAEFVFNNQQYKGVGETVNLSVLLELTNKENEIIIIFIRQL